MHGQSEINFYKATKRAVSALTEGLRLELEQARSNIRVSVGVLQPTTPAHCLREIALIIQYSLYLYLFYYPVILWAI